MYLSFFRLTKNSGACLFGVVSQHLVRLMCVGVSELQKESVIMYFLVFEGLFRLSLILLLLFFHSITVSLFFLSPASPLLFHIPSFFLPHHLSLSFCKLRGLKSLKAFTPVALAAAMLSVWMCMNISSGGERGRGKSGEGGRD